MLVQLPQTLYISQNADYKTVAMKFNKIKRQANTDNCPMLSILRTTAVVCFDHVYAYKFPIWRRFDQV